MDEIISAIKNSFEKLKNTDGILFQCPYEKYIAYDSRKLHEVCINHRLANYLEQLFLPIFQDSEDRLFVDIEFNHEGTNQKEMIVEGIQKTVRPDIIVHNRKTGDEKKNILVVECKKKPVSNSEQIKDRNKIEAFLREIVYSYRYGLQAFYTKTGVEGTFYYLENEELKTKTI